MSSGDLPISVHPALGQYTAHAADWMLGCRDLGSGTVLPCTVNTLSPYGFSLHVWSLFNCRFILHCYESSVARLHFLNCSCVEETEKIEKKSQKDCEKYRFVKSSGRSWASARSPMSESPSLSLPLCIREETYFWSVHLSKLKRISYPCNIIHDKIHLFADSYFRVLYP